MRDKTKTLMWYGCAASLLIAAWIAEAICLGNWRTWRYGLYYYGEPTDAMVVVYFAALAFVLAWTPYRKIKEEWSAGAWRRLKWWGRIVLALFGAYACVYLAISCIVGLTSLRRFAPVTSSFVIGLLLRCDTGVGRVVKAVGYRIGALAAMVWVSSIGNLWLRPDNDCGCCSSYEDPWLVAVALCTLWPIAAIWIACAIGRVVGGKFALAIPLLVIVVNYCGLFGPGGCVACLLDESKGCFPCRNEILIGAAVLYHVIIIAGLFAAWRNYRSLRRVESMKK